MEHENDSKLLRKDLAIAHRLLAHYKMDELTWNHSSVRDPTNGSFLITPGNKHFACIEPGDLVDGNTKDLKNITGNVIHGAVYQGRTDVNAIVHCHTPATVFISCLPDKLKLYT